MNNQLPLLAALTLWLETCPAQAQWITQSITLKTGWNAVYLHVDASHDSLANLVGADASNPIVEVWRWLPAISTAQFVQSPQDPAINSQWESWNRNATTDQLLQRLMGNSAYLVRSASNYIWTVKGKPQVPAYEWTTTGLNFLGFPTVPAGPRGISAATRVFRQGAVGVNIEWTRSAPWVTTGR